MSLNVTQIVVSVHGMRSKGSWSESLMTDIQADPRFADTLCWPISYPWLPATVGWGASWFPFIRHWYTNWMERQLVHIQREFPKAALDIVAHSYGTWLVWHAIRRSYEHEHILRICRLLLVASVLRSDDPLLPVARQQVARLTNYWSSNDTVVLFAPPPFGRAGQEGLKGQWTDDRGDDWHLDHTGYFDATRWRAHRLDRLAA